MELVLIPEDINPFVVCADPYNSAFAAAYRLHLVAVNGSVIIFYVFMITDLPCFFIVNIYPSMIHKNEKNTFLVLQYFSGII